MFVSEQAFVKTGLCPSWFVPKQICVSAYLCLNRFVSVLLVSKQVCVEVGLCLSMFVLGRIKFNQVCV